MSIYLYIIITTCIFTHTYSMGDTHDILSELTIAAPFTQYTSQGSRHLHQYTLGGEATLKKSYIRLTSDTPQQVGWLWSTQAIHAPDWSITLQARISGSAKDLYGDGLALWVVQAQQARPGKLMGSHGNFHGIGVLIDTYRNMDTAKHHRDVALIVSGV